MNDPCPVAMRGIVPSLNTPFDAAGAIDVAAVERLVDVTVAAGVAGMLVLAVAGEQGTLSRAEKTAVAETIVARTARRVPVVVSVTHESLEESIALATMAARAGADSTCWQVPKGHGAAVIDAAKRVADAGPDLLMIQDLDWGGGGLALADIAALFESVPRFRSLKVETVPAGPKYSRVLAETGGRLHVAGGWAVMQMPEALARGVHAFMPTGLDPLYVAIHRAWMAGDHARARAIFERALPLLAFTNQHIDVSIRTWKRYRWRGGIFATDHCRAPPPLDAIQSAECDRVVARALELDREFAARR